MVLMGKLDCLKGLGYGTDLVELDQDGVGSAQVDALLQSLDIGNEQVITYQLYSAAQLLGHLYPAFPVFFIQAIFDGDNGILVDQALPMRDQLFGSKCKAALGLFVEADALLFVFPLGGSGVHSQDEIFSGLIAGIFDRLADMVQSILI